MHHLFFSTTTATATMPIKSPNSTSLSKSPNPNPNSPSSSSSSSSSSHHHHHHHHPHSPSATLDLLIFILVLFSGTFLITSYFSYIFNSLSLLLSHPTLHLHIDLPPIPILPYLLGFIAFTLTSILSFEFLCGARSRKCGRPGCKGLKKAMEFDLQLQTEDCVKTAAGGAVDKLPWKGGSENNPDYECLRAELRKMAPPNGRAVLLFRARCGCPIAKLEGWGPKKGRRHKKALGNGAVNGKDHR